MLNTRTQLLKARDSGELSRSLDRLSSDRRVGGLLLKDFVDPEDTNRLVTCDGEGISELPSTQNLFSMMAKIVAHDSIRFSTTEIRPFISEHAWHLGSQNNDQPCLRLWLHLRGHPEFWLARARSQDVGSNYYGDDFEAVAEDAYCSPATFKPAVGDALLFVDHGSERFGPSTIHKVDVAENRHQRLSIACDINFDI